MRELTMTEAEDVAGGMATVTAFALGVAASLAGAYIYEKLGGAEGVEKLAKAAVKALAEGAKARSEVCRRAPAACVPVG